MTVSKFLVPLVLILAVILTLKLVGAFGQPVLSVNRHSFYFYDPELGASTRGYLYLGNTGDGTLRGSITTAESWLSVSPTKIKVTDDKEEVTVAVNTTGLPYGFEDTGYINIETNGGDVQVSVILTMTEGTLIFEDDFRDPKSGWYVGSSDTGERSYENGSYRLLVKKAGWMILGHNPDIDQLDDFVLEVDASPSLSSAEDSEYGVVFRRQSPVTFDNLCCFEICSGYGRYRIRKQLNDEWSTLKYWTYSSYIRKGTSTNHLKVVCQGEQIAVYVNGHHLDTVTDSSFSKGYISLAAGSGAKSGGDVLFDNLKIHVPALSKIAFTSDRDGNNEIYVMNADGTNQTRLTNDPADDDSPAWSPSGTKIVFRSFRGSGDCCIYVMAADGTSQTRSTSSLACDHSPAWSPRGTKIAFASNRDGNCEIYVMNPDGSSQTRLTRSPDCDHPGAWSPDGAKIAFESERDGNYEIYVMNADGSNQTRLTTNPDDDTDPAWSPDGAKIVFESERDGNNEIYVMNADGSNQTRLTTNPDDDTDPAWSPDGAKIVFESERDGNYEIYVMNADGSNQTRLTNDPGDDVCPAWSPR